MKLPFVAIKTAKNQKEVARYLKKRYKVIDENSIFNKQFYNKTITNLAKKKK
jgi:hypothetical protein